MNSDESHVSSRSLQFADSEAVMRHALSIAGRGAGYVEPNPCVGAVITDSELRLVAEGWHERLGSNHAEVNAIRGVSGSCRDLTLFVTLEPCSHTGRTPPCTDAVLAAGFRRVVIGCVDPAEHAAGRGIAILRSNGVEVQVGCCGSECQRLIAPFHMLMTKHRPWVIAKWAMSLDGRIAARTGHSRWISSESSRQRVHQLRAIVDAIVTGAGTVRSDNPLLTARPAGPRIPLRVVMDRTGTSITTSTQLSATARQHPVCVVVTKECDSTQRGRLLSRGVEVLEVASDERGQPCLLEVLSEFGRRRFTKVLLEAGPSLLGAFFDQRLVDEVCVYIAPKLVGGQGAVPAIGGLGLPAIPELPNLDRVRIEQLGSDIQVTGDVLRTSDG